ncbi:MAG: hypothetical protein AMS27_12845 [Bacteroides sp. SM23_62_1]|nr:MAG: hypothetical protein AMS27_12845 [Bacteroides sp. SM23_62_1]
MGGFRAYKIVFILFLFFQHFQANAQTDTEFWFAAPEITASHCGGVPSTCPGGEPVFFRVSAMDLASTVRIYQPANPAGLDTTFNVPANSTVSINASAWINDLENIPGGIVLNKGVRITSTNLITVYYDEDEYWNKDIFALKGKNALGKEFYTPFNNLWNNGNYNPIQPYSSIDIVATEDNTQITITPTANIVGHPAFISFVITLNKGQTYSCLATSQTAAGHLGGTHIVSNKPIAVTIKDDSVSGNTCRDLIGDQTVPILRALDNRRIVGYEYIVMRGKININNPGAVPPDPPGTPTGERIFIMAVQPNTQVFIDGAWFANLTNPGNQTVFELSNNSTHVRGDKPVMVLHASGFGCELGGAVLPTIDGCTGSLEVSFTRSTDDDFYLNIMTIDAAKDAFTMHYEDGSTYLIPGGWFEPVGATGFVCLKRDNKLFLNAKAGGVPQNEVVKITNSVSVFHLGLIEGGRTTGCKYGYFSDYAESRGSVVVVETGSQSIFRCFGDTAQLRATGGITYTWSPSDYLDDPFIATPIAAPPPGVYNYTVTINRPCFPDTSFTVIVGIADEVEAFFEMDKWDICAPDTVIFDNQSFGVDMSSIYNVQWDFDYEDPFNGYVYDTNAVFQRVFNNTSDTIDKNTIQLIVWNDQSCVSEFRRDIIIRPEITAGFTTDITEGCHPVTVNFTNTSTGNTDRYKWTLGDGNSSAAVNPTHTYINTGMTDLTFNVKMVAISPFYCKDSVETDIDVYPYLEAAFATDTFQGCSPLTIGIDNNSAGYIEEYAWAFGDGATSNSSAATLSHTYTNTTAAPIQRNLRLIVKNNTRGCADTLTRIIKVFPEVTASFTQDNASGCNGLQVNFTNLSTATATMFDWEFGDGGSSTSKNPSHTYENMTLVSVDYDVRLVSTTPNLCQDTTYGTITIHPYINADYSVDEFQGCAPFTVTLQNSAEGAITQYEWDWGDGSPVSTSSGVTQTHIYQNDGGATVIRSLQLTVENAAGCLDTMKRNITVFPRIISQFTQNTTAGCQPLSVQFTNQSNAAATSFIWEFGDGGSSIQQNTGHTFQNFDLVNNTYTTKLIAYSDYECSDTSEVNITVYNYVKADYTFLQLTNCTPFDVTFNNSSVGATNYLWTFGDGEDTTVLNKNPISHGYTNPSTTNTVTYVSKLSAWNANGCLSEMSRNVVAYPIVTAGFSASVTDGCHPLSVNFTNQSTGALNYIWSFDNGQSAYTSDPSVTLENYSLNDRTFDVELVAINANNCRDTFIVPVLVNPYVKADFAIQYIDQCSPATVNFNNSSINGQQYDWSFAGTPYSTTSKNPITQQFTNNSYVNSQNFTVDLQVTSPQGCLSSLSKQVSVHHMVTSTFSNVTEGCHPLIVDFTNTSQGADDYFWDFGDDGSSIYQDPDHTFTNLGNNDSTYTVSLVALTDDNCRDTAYSLITVWPRPKAKFTVDNSVDCPPFEVTVQNVSQAGNTYNWDFGDGTSPLITYDLSPVTHTYYNDNVATVTNVLKLLVESVHGCTDEITQNMNVYPSLIADFERDSAGCSPYQSVFTNTSLRAASFQWDFGDGVSSSLSYPIHTFTNDELNDKIFDVRLISISRFGCTDTITKQVTVYPQPVAEFDYSPVYQYFPSATVTLINETNAGYFNYLWDFNDNSQSTQQDPGSHIYSTWGTYNISLNVSNDHCQDSVAHWIRIFAPLPIAEFEADIYEGCVPLTLTFENLSQYGEEYYWEFDDGATSTQFEPVHTYEVDGLYQARLTVTSEGGQDVAFKEVTAYVLPVVDFKVEPNLVMLPDQPAKAFNFSRYGTSYLWDFGDGTSSTEEEIEHFYTELGVYDVSLTVWTEHNCVNSKTLPEAVTVIGKGEVRFPNVFAPNLTGSTGGDYDPTDKSNQVFFPVHDGVMEYKLQIFSRWGELIFETTNVNVGWDGYYKGHLCDQGVYIWKVSGKYSNGRYFEEVGDVTLLHHEPE